MKQLFTRKLMLLAAMLLTSIGVSAYDFMVDGIAYNVVNADDKTVEVTYPGNNMGNDGYSLSVGTTIPQDVTYGTRTFKVVGIGESAFNHAYVYSISLPSTIQYIGNYGFYNSQLWSIEIPSSVTSIGSMAFGDCNFSEITLPAGLTQISDNCFTRCRNLKSITLPNSVKTIGSSAFSSCESLTAIEMPGVTLIGNYAFQSCTKLSNLVIPDQVTTIEYHAFENCSAMSMVTIGSGVLSIGDEAFKGCGSLQAVISKSTSAPNLGSNVFPTTVKWDATLFVPDASIANYSSWGFDHVKGLSEYQTCTISCNDNNVQVNGASVSFPLTVMKGASLKLSYDYSFTAWTIVFNKFEINGVDITDQFNPYNSYTFTVTGDTQINVDAKVVQNYEVIIENFDSGMGTVTVGDWNVMPGSSAWIQEGPTKLIVTPNDGYQIASVVIFDGNGVEQDVTSDIIKGSGTYTFNLSSKTTIRVQFKYQSFRISWNKRGAVTINGNSYWDSDYYDYEPMMMGGNTIKLGYMATSAYGATLISYKVDGVEVKDEILTNGYYTLTITKDVNIEVEYVDNVALEMVYDNSAGTISVNGTPWIPGAYAVYQKGKDVTLTVAPNAGYAISSVQLISSYDGSVIKDLTDDVKAGNGNCTITLNQDMKLQVNFIQSFDLEFTYNNGGKVTVDGNAVTSGQKITCNGSMCRVFVEADEGYEIASVKMNDVEQMTVTGTMTRFEFWPNYSAKIEVVFQRTKCILTTHVQGKGGYVEISGSQVYSDGEFSIDPGSDVTINFITEPGYEIVSASLDAANDITDAARNGSYTISKINANMVLNVEFAPKPIYLTINDADGGSVSILVQGGSQQTLKIKAAEDWQLNSVTFNDQDVTYQVDADGMFVTPVLTEDATIYVTYTSTTTGASGFSAAKFSVRASKGQVMVSGVKDGEQISVYNVDGKVVTRMNAQSGNTIIPLAEHQTYIITVGRQTAKVRL